MPGPLQGIQVVEFSTMIATPTAGMLLADMGASVIKVEPPWGFENSEISIVGPISSL